jgi:ABC-type arginine transport system permease subunit
MGRRAGARLDAAAAAAPDRVPASVIGFVELTRAAQVVNNATFRPLLVYASVAVIYFLLCWPLSVVSQRLERQLGRRQERVMTVSA